MEEPERSVVVVVIGPMSQADIPDVVKLEEGSGLNSLGRAGFERQLARAGSILLVARAATSQDSQGSQCSQGNLGPLIGSLSGWVIADEFQIDNVVVLASARREGIGAALIRRGVLAAADRGAEKGVLEVRSANLAARRLYQKLGFALVAKRPDYYRDPADDALVMICHGGEWDRLVA